MLENSLYKLKNSASFTVGYFGGSITEGAGASDASKTSWRAKTSSWLAEKFPSCEIKSVQAAIGGTGSELGVYRCDIDLTAFHPDLVFFEFAVNDGCGGDWREYINNAESIFRKLLTADPTTDIIVTYTTTKSVSDHLSKGREFTARSAHGTVAYYYGFPQLDIGEVLRSKVLSDGGDWGKYTIDTVHPNDDGYEIYSDCVRRFLGELFDSARPICAPEPYKLPKPLAAENSKLNARMEDCSRAKTGKGWSVEERSMCGRYPRYLEATEPGAELEFRFTGSRIGLYWMMAKDSGDIEYSVDGGEYKTVSSWDHYCLGFNRAGSVMLDNRLPFGEHCLKLRVSRSKSGQSEGYAIRIGTFLVS